jgi:hypothetical protein
MAVRILQAVAERQHGVASRRQLVAAGLTQAAIDHQLSKGHLHLVHRGVYAVGRAQLTRYGSWMAAVLACWWSIGACSERQDVSDPEGIPVTNVFRTLIDLAAYMPAREVEAALNEAVKLDLIDIELLNASIEALPPMAGKTLLRELADGRTFRLTDSELERLLLRLIRQTDLPTPETGYAKSSAV